MICLILSLTVFIKRKESLQDTFAKAAQSYRNREFKTGELYCYKILSIDPNHFDSISMLASISAFSGNFDKAVELLKKAIKVQPKNTRALHNLGTSYKELGKLNEAINYYKQVLQIDPKHTNAHYKNDTNIFHKNSVAHRYSYRQCSYRAGII